MNNHYLQFVREQLIIATADLSGATKGQLEAWQENAMFDTGRYPTASISDLLVVVMKKATAGITIS